MESLAKCWRYVAMFRRSKPGMEIKGVVYYVDKNAENIQVLKDIKIKLVAEEKVNKQDIRGSNTGITIFKEKLVDVTSTDNNGGYKFRVLNGNYKIKLDESSLPEGKGMKTANIRIDKLPAQNMNFIVEDQVKVKQEDSSRIYTLPDNSSKSSLDMIRNAYDTSKIDNSIKIQQYLHMLFKKSMLSREYRSRVPIKSGSTAVKEIYDYIESNDADENIVKTARSYLSSSVPALDKSYISPSGYFNVHYTTSGGNSVTVAKTNSEMIPEYIVNIGRAFDNVKTVCSQRGFKTPVLDPGKSTFDIYVCDLKGNYGITFPQTFYSSGKAQVRRASCYITIDNSYSNVKGFKEPKDSCMRVTAAHEFFHAIQNAYNADADSWWKEASATWNEDEVYSDVNDYLQYLGGVFLTPQKSLETCSYSGVVFAKYLSENWGGYNMIKRIWEIQATLYRNSINAIDIAIKEKYKGNDLGSLYNKYTACNYNPSQYYKEGALWNSNIAVQNVHNTYPVTLKTGNINHLSSNYQLFNFNSADKGKKLKITIEGDRRVRWGFKLQRKRLCDNLCEITEVNMKGAEGASIICEGVNNTYKEVCFIPSNLEKSQDGGNYSYRAVLE
jgi:hypothetical protein